MSVTDNGTSAREVKSRNTVLLAEFNAEQERHKLWQEANPERAARLAELGAAISGRAAVEESEEDERARSLHYFAERTSYSCPRCDYVFEDGDVVYRKRESNDTGGMYAEGWSLTSHCDKCVRKWHPSWRKNRREPVPCAGGCGVLVSDWQDWKRITTCSSRCSETASAARRRVEVEPRDCEVCGDSFTPSRSDARYCSNACRQDAYRIRKAHP